MKKHMNLLSSLLLGTWLIVLPVVSTANILDIIEAEKLEQRKQYSTALQLLIKINPKNQTTEVRRAIARLYSKIDDKRNAERWYRRVVRDKKADPEVLKEFGDVLLFNGKYGEARQAYFNYQQRQKQPVKGVSPALLVTRCDSAQSMSQRPPKYSVSNENKLNSAQSDFGLAILGEYIYFTSDRPASIRSNLTAYSDTTSELGVVQVSTRTPRRTSKKLEGERFPGTGRFFLNVFSANRLQRDGSAGRNSEFMWSEILPLPAPINQSYHTGPVSFSPDGNRVVFAYSSLEQGTTKKNAEIAYVGLMTATRNGSHWTKPTPLDITKITEYSVGDPCISSDGEILYFASDMPGGQGGIDLYMCKSLENGKWGAPINLGPTINTPGNERFPTVHKDTLYFSSDGHIGLGGLDIFKAIGTVGNWTGVENLLAPINSSADDFSMVFFSEGKDGLFCSNREGGVGGDDIYYFKESLSHSAPVSSRCNIFLGTVTDKKTNTPIPKAQVVVLDVVAQRSSLTTTDEQGNFIVCLEPSVNYTVSTSAEGYLYTSVSNVTLSSLKKDTTRLPMRVEAVEKDKVYNLDNINYAFGKSTLQRSSFRSLDILSEFLSANLSLCIEIGSHTDSKGNAEKNTELSQKRAEACRDYLITKGTNPGRIKIVGHGSKFPKIKNAKTERQHAQNRRTEFKVVNCL